MKIKLLNNQNRENAIRTCTSAGLLSRTEGKVTDVVTKVNNMEFEKAQKILNNITSMGHTSIVDTDYFVFALEDIPVIIEQLIIQSRFSAFTIKSRREANFANEGFYTPNLGSNFLDKVYQQNMEDKFWTYETMVKHGIKKEDARYILPYCFKSQMLMGMNATELSKIINRLTKGDWSKISAAKEFGELLKSVVTKNAPYINTILNKYKEQQDSPIEKTLNSIVDKDNYNNYEILDNPIITSHTLNIDDKIIINAISRIYQYDIDMSTRIYNAKIKGNQELINEIFKAIRSDINKIDLSHISITAQIPISFANLTHITRHRTTKLSIPEFTSGIDIEKILVPESIKNNETTEYIFNNEYIKNFMSYKTLKNNDIPEEELIYFILSGNLVNILATFDGDTLRHITSLRNCTKAQWEIRNIMTQITEQVRTIAPNYYNIIGANCEVLGHCPEGKESCKKLKPKKL